MFKKTIIVAALIVFSVLGFAQKNINNYKYVLVPKSFDFTKGEDKYQLNSIAKFLFNKYGFEAHFIGDDYPEELQNDRCLGLKVEISEIKGGLFKTRLQIALNDCFGVTVMKSKVGESKLKQFDRAYNEALRDAFTTFKYMSYKYTPIENVVEETKPVKVESEAVEKKKEKKILKTEPAVVVKEKVDKEEKVIVREVEEVKSEAKEELKVGQLYYAQPISNGYQLVDSEPKIVMILLKTGSPDIFIVKDKNAMVIKKEGKWMYSENDGDKVKERELKIKF